MKKYVAVIVVFLVASCGGSSSDNSGRTGLFLDSPVINIDYRTETITGVTNSQGRYNYNSGENVTFSIGDLRFPEVNARSVITPLDLVGSNNINDSRVINILRLLQTLDVDGNPANGIMISDTAKSTATQVDFNLPASEFGNSNAVTSLIFNAGQETSVSELISPTVAIENFQAQLNDSSYVQALDRTYIFNGTEMRITNPGINLDRSGSLQFNLKNNNLSPRQMIQVTTFFTSKQEFDNAFTDRTLVLVGGYVQSAGMEYNGGFNVFNQNSFSVTVTANDNGTYNFISTGSMSSQDGVNTVSRVVVLNIQYGER